MHLNWVWLLVQAGGSSGVVELDELVVVDRGDEVVVEFSGTSGKAVELGAALTTTTLTGLLAGQPGITSSDYGSGISRPVVRGLGGWRVAVLEGGLGTGDLSASSPDHAVAIEPLLVREVIWYPGAAGFFHAGAAIGGAVDAEPVYLPEAGASHGSKFTAGGGYNSVNQGSVGYVHAGHDAQQWGLRVHGIWRDQEDYRIAGAARTEDYDRTNRMRLPPSVRGRVAPNPQGKVPNTDLTTRVLAAGSRVQHGGIDYRIGFQSYRSEYGVPEDGHVHGNPYGSNPDSAPGPQDNVRIEIFNDRWIAGAQIRPSADGWSGAELRLAHSRFRQLESEGIFPSNRFANLHREGQLQVGTQLGRLHSQWQLSLQNNQYSNENFSYFAGRVDRDLLQTRSNKSGFSALHEWDLEPTILRFGARLERQKASRSDRSGLTREETAGGAILEWTQSWLAALGSSLSIHYAERLPNAEELFIEAPHGATGVFQLPDPALQRERSHGMELRLNGDVAFAGWSLSTYWRRFDGFIYLENQGFEVEGLTAHRFVPADAQFHGIEAMLNGKFFTTATLQASWNAWADFVRGKNLARKEHLPRIPPLRLGAQLHLQSVHWLLRASILHARPQNHVPQAVFGTLRYQSPTPSHTLIDLSVSRTWIRPQALWQFTIGIDNLLNQQARQHTSFIKDVAPSPGRNLRASFNVSY